MNDIEWHFEALHPISLVAIKLNPGHEESKIYIYVVKLCHGVQCSINQDNHLKEYDLLLSRCQKQFGPPLSSCQDPPKTTELKSQKGKKERKKIIRGCFHWKVHLETGNSKRQQLSLVSDKTSLGGKEEKNLNIFLSIVSLSCQHLSLECSTSKVWPLAKHEQF